MSKQRYITRKLRRASLFTGKSAGSPALWAERKADLIIISSFPGSAALWAGNFISLHEIENETQRGLGGMR